MCSFRVVYQQDLNKSRHLGNVRKLQARRTFSSRRIYFGLDGRVLPQSGSRCWSVVCLVVLTNVAQVVVVSGIQVVRSLVVFCHLHGLVVDVYEVVAPEFEHFPVFLVQQGYEQPCQTRFYQYAHEFRGTPQFYSWLSRLQVVPRTYSSSSDIPVKPQNYLVGVCPVISGVVLCHWFCLKIAGEPIAKQKFVQQFLQKKVMMSSNRDEILIRK